MVGLMDTAQAGSHHQNSVITVLEMYQQIWLPNVEEALEIDCLTGIDFSQKVIEKEMKNIQVAFQFLDDDVVPASYKHI